MVRRVLNGPCAGGHGGQVTGEQISHGQKASRRFQSVKHYLPVLKTSHHPPCIDQRGHLDQQTPQHQGIHIPTGYCGGDRVAPGSHIFDSRKFGFFSHIGSRNRGNTLNGFNVSTTYRYGERSAPEQGTVRTKLAHLLPNRRAVPE